MLGARKKTRGRYPNFKSSYPWCCKIGLIFLCALLNFQLLLLTMNICYFNAVFLLKTFITANLKSYFVSDNFYSESFSINTFTEI